MPDSSFCRCDCDCPGRNDGRCWCFEDYCACASSPEKCRCPSASSRPWEPAGKSTMGLGTALKTGLVAGAAMALMARDDLSEDGVVLHARREPL